jgi:hypothetical protein
MGTGVVARAHESSAEAAAKAHDGEVMSFDDICHY